MFIIIAALMLPPCYAADSVVYCLLLPLFDYDTGVKRRQKVYARRRVDAASIRYSRCCAAYTLRDSAFRAALCGAATSFFVTLLTHRC